MKEDECPRIVHGLVKTGKILHYIFLTFSSYDVAKSINMKCALNKLIISGSVGLSQILIGVCQPIVYVPWLYYTFENLGRVVITTRPNELP